jgi:hypothetical protein
LSITIKHSQNTNTPRNEYTSELNKMLGLKMFSMSRSFKN